MSSRFCSCFTSLHFFTSLHHFTSLHFTSLHFTCTNVLCTVSLKNLMSLCLYLTESHQLILSWNTACYSYILTFVRKEINNITNKRNMYITRITKTTKFQTCMNTEDHQDKRCHYQCDDCGQDIQENTVRRKYCLIWKFHLHQIHCCIPC